MKKKLTFFEKLKKDLIEEIFDILPNTKNITLITIEVDKFLRIKKNEYDGLKENTLEKLFEESRKEVLNNFNKDLKKEKTQQKLIEKIKNDFLNKVVSANVGKNNFASFIISEVQIYFSDEKNIKKHPELLSFYLKNNKINFSEISSLLIKEINKDIDKIQFKPHFAFCQDNLTKRIEISLLLEEINKGKDNFGHDKIEFLKVSLSDFYKVLKNDLVPMSSNESYLTTPLNSIEIEKLKEQSFILDDNKLKVVNDKKMLTPSSLSSMIAVKKDLPFSSLKNDSNTSQLFWDEKVTSKKINLKDLQILKTFLDNPIEAAQFIFDINDRIKNQIDNRTLNEIKETFEYNNV